VSAPTAETLRKSLCPLTEDPQRAAIFCDIDGTLAPIVRRPEEARVREEISLLLSRLGRRYGCVACVSGRPVAEARRLVGVGSIAYAGAHGAELLHAGQKKSTLAPAFASWEPRVRRFVNARANVRELRLLRIRIEDKGPIKAFHWRDVPDEQAAESWLSNVAQEAEAEGFATHWGRKVLDAYDALDKLQAAGTLDATVRVGVQSAEGPPAIVERADVVVDGVRGMIDVLTTLAE
jgi:trehalose 6-phosphate phosphatase